MQVVFTMASGSIHVIEIDSVERGETITHEIIESNEPIMFIRKGLYYVKS